MSTTLTNLKSICGELKTDECGSSNTDRKWMAYIENFESCQEFEDVTDEKKKRSALLAVGGAELRDILRTLDEDTPNTYDTAKAALGTYFKAKKNLTAERYRFFCMKPESSTESHDHWITRLKTAGVDCEFDKMDLKEAIKLAVTMHTNSSKLQAEIIAQDMSYEKMVEKARAIELTKKEVEYMKQTEEAFKVEASAVDAVRRESKIQYKGDTQPGSKPVRFRDRPGYKSQGNRQSKNCQSCGEHFTDQHDCRARNVTCYKCQRPGHFARMCKTKNTVDYLQGTPE